MCKSEPGHRGYLVGLLFREISMKREEQNNRHVYAVLKTNWSMRVAECIITLVGFVIVGMKPFDMNMSR